MFGEPPVQRYEHSYLPLLAQLAVSEVVHTFDFII
jgi:hypothetical protein